MKRRVNMTTSSEPATISVPIALTEGSMDSRARDQITSGSVLWSPIVKKVIWNSSQESASTQKRMRRSPVQ